MCSQVLLAYFHVLFQQAWRFFDAKFMACLDSIIIIIIIFIVHLPFCSKSKTD